MVGTLTVLQDDRLMAFERCLTFAEYCSAQGDRGQLLEMRYAESRLTPATQYAMTIYGEILNVVAIVTDEDPDTIAVLPVIARLIDASLRIQLRVLSEAGDLTPLETLLPDLDVMSAIEEWVLPQFLIFDDEWELQAQWGPRPAKVEGNLAAWLNRYPEYELLADDESTAAQQRYVELTTALSYEMRVWYNSSMAAACQHEFCELLATLLPSDENGESGYNDTISN
jgi:hypothetical protein